jgi:hypothetical protein
MHSVGRIASLAQVRRLMASMGDHCDSGQEPTHNPSSHPPAETYWTAELPRCLVQHYDRWIFRKWNFTLPVEAARCAQLLDEWRRKRDQRQGENDSDQRQSDSDTDTDE